MKKAIVLLTVTAIICCTSCKDQADQIPPDSFRATVQNLVKSNDMLVKHVVLQATGERTVKVNGKKATIEPTLNTDFMTAEIVFVATLVKSSESANMIKWLIQIKGQGGGVGGSSTFPIEAESLDDVLELKFDQGLYPLGQDITIGKFREEPIILSVK